MYIIEIEGLDGSGKATQSEMLVRRLKEETSKFVFMKSFPSKNVPSGYFVEQYLNGNYGEATELDPKVASLFYALDRYDLSMIMRDYHGDSILLFDRYVGSNIIHQTSKGKTLQEKMELALYIDNLEYGLLKLPRPNVVLFLDMPPTLSSRLVDSRGRRKDQHETNLDYLELCYESSLWFCEVFGWKRVPCYKGNTIFSKEEIHETIYNIVKSDLCGEGMG